MSAAILTITARLARDPEQRRSQSGTSITTLTLPVDTGWGDNKTTTWWKVTLFGKRGESAAQHLAKGQWVCVSGSASVREYEGKNGKGFSPEMVASDWSFVGPKEKREEQWKAPVSNGDPSVIPF